MADLIQGMSSLKEMLDIPRHIKIRQTRQPDGHQIGEICKLDKNPFEEKMLAISKRDKTTFY